MTRSSAGTFRYSPKNNGSMRRRDGGTTEWWLVIDCDPELGRYFRHLYQRSRWNTVVPREPLWGVHISVVRDEQPPAMSAWKSLEGQAVEFDFAEEVTDMEGYLWVAVGCEVALDHRVELGLEREPWPPLHMTVGNFTHEATT